VAGDLKAPLGAITVAAGAKSGDLNAGGAITALCLVVVLWSLPLVSSGENVTCVGFLGILTARQKQLYRRSVRTPVGERKIKTNNMQIFISCKTRFAVCSLLQE
jgi:hypothetical protein